MTPAEQLARLPARGGEHSRPNAQASHLYCNTVKGIRAVEEVA